MFGFSLFPKVDTPCRMNIFCVVNGAILDVDEEVESLDSLDEELEGVFQLDRCLPFLA